MWERPDVRTFAQQGSPSAAALVAAVYIYGVCNGMQARVFRVE